MFQNHRFFFRDDGISYGTKWVFAFQFHVVWLVCSLLTAAFIAGGLPIIHSLLTASTKETFRIFNSGYGSGAQNVGGFAVRHVVDWLPRLLRIHGSRFLPMKRVVLVFLVLFGGDLGRDTNEKQSMLLFMGFQPEAIL